MYKAKAWIYSLLLFSLIQAISYSCANISSPTGGPKDTIPPALLKINPANQSVNFNDRIVRLEFNEAIQQKDLANQLIITPSIESKYKTKLSKNVVELIFEEDFEPNTTYTFSFREGISDLNEGNLPKDLQLAFSTGAYLDSLSISGQVKELLSGKAVEDGLVSLFPAADTLNTFNSRPYYLAKTDKEGYFRFNNLKAGDYLVFATKDVNKNLKTEARNEAFGFLKDTTSITSNIDSLHINILRVDISEPQINSSRPSGNYYEINLNKAIQEYSLEPLKETQEKLYSNLVDKNKKIRVYKTFPVQDSLAVAFSAKDSLHQQIQDTLYVRFEESKRAPEEFKYTVDPAGGPIQEEFSTTLSFSKPVLTTNTDSLFFQYDSLNRLAIEQADLRWNERRDQLSIRKQLDASKALIAPPKPQEGEEAMQDGEEVPQEASAAAPKEIALYIGKGAFISVEKDSAKAKTQQYKFADPKNFGTIEGTVQTSADSFFVQLLQAGNQQVVKEIRNEKNFTFRTIPPGEYQIRVLIDRNGNGQWDPGNVKKRMEPEPVLFSEGTIPLKANWEIKDISIGE